MTFKSALISTILAIFVGSAGASAQMSGLRDDPRSQQIMDDYSALTVAYFVNEACDILSQAETRTLRTVVNDATAAMDTWLDERVGARRGQALMIGLQRDSYAQAQRDYGACDSMARSLVAERLSSAHNVLASLQR